MEILTVLVLMCVGYFFGQAAQRKHYRELAIRERAIRIPLRADRMGLETAAEGTLVTGSAVIGQDYFKEIVSNLQNILGGNVRAYESLMDRARREAIVRMMERAQGMGAHEVVNLRVENFPVGKAGAVEVCAYATAVRHAVRSQG